MVRMHAQHVLYTLNPQIEWQAIDKLKFENLSTCRGDREKYMVVQTRTHAPSNAHTHMFRISIGQVTCKFAASDDLSINTWTDVFEFGLSFVRFSVKLKWPTIDLEHLKTV